MNSETRPLGGPLDPLDWATRYGERRAEREAEERENPAVACEYLGIHLATLGTGVCVQCGEEVW